MNDGQTGGSNNNSDFFTAGVGDQAPTVNPELDQSINVDSFTPETDPRRLGNNAINALGASSEDKIPDVEQLGMPPGYQPEPVIKESDVATNPEVNEPSLYQDIRTGEKLSKDGYNAIEKACRKLDKTDNIADFNNEIRAMMLKNLDNSYNRKVGQ